MPKACWVVTYRSVSDPQKLAAYAEFAVAATAPFGARFLARGNPAVVYRLGRYAQRTNTNRTTPLASTGQHRQTAGVATKALETSAISGERNSPACILVVAHWMTPSQ